MELLFNKRKVKNACRMPALHLGLVALADAEGVLWEAGAELAGGEGVEGAEAGGE